MPPQEINSLERWCGIPEFIFSLIVVILVRIHFGIEVISGLEWAAYISIGSLVLWNIIEEKRIKCLFHIILSLFYFTVAGMALHDGKYYSMVLAGGIFGLLAATIHVIDGIWIGLEYFLLCPSRNPTQESQDESESNVPSASE